MAYPDNFLDDLRERTNLADLIGRTVKLKKQGHRWLGLCPFHQEKTPSFNVNPDKGFYHCFGCGQHGSAFDFLMATEGLRFPEAVERLAAMAGMSLPAQSHDPAAAAAQAERKGLYPLLEAATAWFQSTLAANPGRTARDYLSRRGIGAQAIAQFRLGYAPGNAGDLKQAMLSRGFSMQQLHDAGLITEPEDGGEPYNRFRDRLMFPILDLQGRPVAFGGRALGNQRAKYLNSPETTLFQKGRMLYNAAPARAAAQKSGRLLVVEGYMDVIALQQNGILEAVAPLGTAVTEAQLALLWRMTPEPILCFDGDEAGQRAAQRAAERALPLLKPGRSLYFMALPPGEDPDSMIAAEGAAAFSKRFADAKPMAAQLWQMLIEEGEFNTPERLAGLRQRMAALTREIKDDEIAGFYKIYFRDAFAAAFTPASGGAAGGYQAGQKQGYTDRRGGGYARRGRGGNRPGASWSQMPWQPPVPPLSGTRTLGEGINGSTKQREMVLVAAFLSHPRLAEEFSEELATLPISDPGLDRIRGAILQQSTMDAPLDAGAVRAYLSEYAHSGGDQTGEDLSGRTIIAKLDELASRPLQQLAPFIRSDADFEETRRGWLSAYGLHLLREMRQDLRLAEEAFAEQPTEANQKRLLACKSALDAYERDAIAVEAPLGA